MENLTIAQKVYLATLLAVACTWLGLEIGIPVYEYSYGKSALTALLAQLSSVLLLAGFGIVVIGWILQGMGILPMVRRGSQPAGAMGSSVRPVSPLRNLVIWIVIAVALVFLFNLFQGTGSKSHPDPVQHPVQLSNPDLLGIFINWFPLLFICGIWVFFLRRMQARQGKDLDKPSDP